MALGVFLHDWTKSYLSFGDFVLYGTVLSFGVVLLNTNNGVLVCLMSSNHCKK